MDQQSEQQPQPAQQPEVLQPQSTAVDLPAVPVVSEAPLPQSPPLNVESPIVQQPPEIASEPMGRPAPQTPILEWQASEYIEHEKSVKWFVFLGAVTLVLVAVAIFLLKNYTFALLLVVMAVSIAMLARRPAGEVHYKLDTTGVWVNEKHFELHDFRHFGVLQDGGIYAVVLVPTKRFSPGVTVYFPHELGEQIVDILGAALPMEDMQPDWIDRLTRRLNF